MVCNGLAAIKAAMDRLRQIIAILSYFFFFLSYKHNVSFADVAVNYRAIVAEHNPGSVLAIFIS